MVPSVARTLVIAGLLAVAGVAVVQARPHVGDDRLKPESLATCWDCHNTIQNDCPPLQTFVNLLPQAGAGADVGGEFDFTVQAQNTWCADLYAVNVNLDLTNAPSLGFASGVDDFSKLVDDVIDVNIQNAQQPQRKEVPVDVPAGETQMEVRLRSTDSPVNSELSLLVYRPGDNTQGAPFRTIDAPKGGDKVFTIATREEFVELGYGVWTFVAQASLVPAGGSVALPSPQQTIPFELSVSAHADASGARIGTVQTANSPGDPLKESGSVPVTFKLTVVGTPGETESLALSADVWPHYTHKSTTDEREDDDENVTKVLAEAVPVVPQGTRASIAGSASPGIITVLPHNGPTMTTISEAVGYATAFLLVSSVWTGGIFGKASRRQLNGVFGTAKRRVAFHNFLSYGILVTAGTHTTLFIIEAAYHWSIGLLWGGLSLLCMVGLGVTGAWQVGLIRAWSYGAWRWTHFALAIGTIVLTLVHMGLDGAHFHQVQNALHWHDPLSSKLSA